MSPASGVDQGALEPAGVHAARIAELFWWFFGASMALWLLVVGALMVAVLRRRSPAEHDAPPMAVPAGSDARARRIVTLAVAATVVTLLAMLVGSIFTGRAVAAVRTTSALTVEVTAHQWWWDFEITDPEPSLRVHAPNELHIPVGRPVRFVLASSDVIHSFWVPRLHGKIDAIPGKKTTIVLQADRAGRYEGKCAEFCGIQHANMRFSIVAEPEEDFARWLAHVRAPAVAPATPEEKRGLDLFMTRRCSTCHTVQGTEARATVGPDLTHVGSRWALGAGALDNTPDHLARWIADPQAVKPGNRMPANPLPGDEAAALHAYLRSLR